MMMAQPLISLTTGFYTSAPLKGVLPFGVRWNDEDTLFGRPLFDYENIDYWTVDPLSRKFQRPRNFGNRYLAAAAEDETNDE